ncbi:MAG: sensor histidine kinase [Halanaeroarchaeum sp.]
MVLSERRRIGSAGAISTIGLATLLVHGYHFLEEEALGQILAGVVPPALVSVGLIGAGIGVYRSDLDDAYHPRILAWTVGGTLGLMALATALLMYQATHGASFEDVPFVVANWAATGALGGCCIGYYDANFKATSAELASERDELRRRESTLQAQIDRLERMSHIVAHDLRNPLTVAKGQVELGLETNDWNRIEAVPEQLDRMDTIIEDTLSMARDGRPVDEAEMEPVDLGEVARQSWQTVETEGATLTVDGEGHVLADESRLRTIFENLFCNAVEHGGESVAVTVGCEDDGFYVADDGRGLPAGTDVFEAGTTTSPDGTGLGLSIVSEIVTAHGWSIEATSSDDGGARFDISGATRRDDR